MMEDADPKEGMVERSVKDRMGLRGDGAASEKVKDVCAMRPKGSQMHARQQRRKVTIGTGQTRTTGTARRWALDQADFRV